MKKIYNNLSSICVTTKPVATCYLWRSLEHLDVHDTDYSLEWQKGVNTWQKNTARIYNECELFTCLFPDDSWVKIGFYAMDKSDTQNISPCAVTWGKHKWN